MQLCQTLCMQMETYNRDLHEEGTSSLLRTWLQFSMECTRVSRGFKGCLRTYRQSTVPGHRVSMTRSSTKPSLKLSSKPDLRGYQGISQMQAALREAELADTAHDGGSCCNCDNLDRVCTT